MLLDLFIYLEWAPNLLHPAVYIGISLVGFFNKFIKLVLLYLARFILRGNDKIQVIKPWSSRLSAENLVWWANTRCTFHFRTYDLNTMKNWIENYVLASEKGVINTQVKASKTNRILIATNSYNLVKEITAHCSHTKFGSS